MTRERREAAAAEVERHALERALILMRAHTPPVEILALITGAQNVAAATRAGAVDPHWEAES